jgi:hypothetical protein
MSAARRIAVMGAGLIGCEFANDLTHAGIAVSVIEPAPWPLSRFVPEPVGPPWSGRSALAKTLAGQPAPVAYPAMPILVKTTAFPVVVAPPATGMPGEWEIEVQTAGARGLYRGPDGRLFGFALAGEAVADKNALTLELPPTLP